MKENSADIKVGRLLEIRVDAGYKTVEDVDAMIAMIGREIKRMPVGTRVVIAADWSGCEFMEPAAADRALVMLSTINDAIERSGILEFSGSSPLADLQFFRLVKQSGHTNRRLFTERKAMVAYLSEVLSPPEIARLKTFLQVT